MERQFAYEVGPKLVEKVLPESDKVRKVWELLVNDVETQAYLKMANVSRFRDLSITTTVPYIQESWPAAPWPSSGY